MIGCQRRLEHRQPDRVTPGLKTGARADTAHRSDNAESFGSVVRAKADYRQLREAELTFGRGIADGPQSLECLRSTVPGRTSNRIRRATVGLIRCSSATNKVSRSGLNRALLSLGRRSRIVIRCRKTRISRFLADRTPEEDARPKNVSSPSGGPAQQHSRSSCREDAPPWLLPCRFRATKPVAITPPACTTTFVTARRLPTLHHVRREGRRLGYEHLVTIDEPEIEAFAVPTGGEQGAGA